MNRKMEEGHDLFTHTASEICPEASPSFVHLSHVAQVQETYLLCSLQQGQVDVGNNVGQSAPLPHAQPTGQLHVALHHGQVRVLRVADCEEASVQVHLYATQAAFHILHLAGDWTATKGYHTCTACS